MTLDCLLCGISGPQVRPLMVEWLEPALRRFEVIPRCTARAECRARVESTGESWPLVDPGDPPNTEGARV
jgi:hypothetical protein